MKKVLNIAKPLLNGYMEDAHPLSILGLYTNTYEWIYSNFIQLIYQDPLDTVNQPLKFFKTTLSGKSWDPQNPWLEYSCINKEILKSLHIDIIDYIICAINHEKYVTLFLDEYYMMYREEYMSCHFVHETFIYGYDEEAASIYILSYNTQTQHYTETKAKFSEVRAGFESNDEGHAVINLLSIRKNYSYEFCRERVLEQCIEYVTSENSLYKTTEFFHQTNDCVFGLDVYQCLIQYCRTDYNIIPFHILLEHKELMFKRIKYMMENEYLPWNYSLLDDGEELVEEASIIKNLIMKLHIYPNDSTFENVCQRLIILQKKDKEFMLRLINELKSNMNKTFQSNMFSKVGTWSKICYSLVVTDKEVFHIEFVIQFINHMSIGYIGIGSLKNLNSYELPWSMNINIPGNYITICGEKKVLLSHSMKSNEANTIKVNLLINIHHQSYNLYISHLNEHFVYENEMLTYSLQDIDHLRLLLVHENGYRFKVSDVVNSLCKNR